MPEGVVAACIRFLALVAGLQHAEALRELLAYPPDPDVLIVQGTNFPLPTAVETTGLFGIPQLEHPEWFSAALMSEYAKMHGYGYRMYIYKPAYLAACEHPERGPLKAQWCKILALRMAYKNFPRTRTFVWMDTDVFILDMTRTIEQVVNTTKTVRFQPITDNTTCIVEEPPLGREQVSVFAWKNSLWDGGCGVCTGTMIFRRTAATEDFLEQWWANAMKIGIPGPYDQGFFARRLYYDHPDKIAVFNEDSLHMDRRQFLVHRLKKAKWIPLPPELYQGLVSHHGLQKSISELMAQVLLGLDTQINETSLAAAA